MSKSVNGAAGPFRDDPPSYRLVEALAEARGCDVLEMEPLGEYIDLEYLDDLIRNSADDLLVRATVGDERVEVRGDGSVRIR